MERSRLIAVVVAGVLGITGGVALAVNRDRPAPTASPSASSSPSPSPSASQQPTGVSGQEGSTNEPLLWANKHQLRDGDRTVELNFQGDVERLVRMDGGWVVAERRSPQESSFTLWWVTPQSTASRFANVVGTWDADPTGRHVVGQAASGQVRVWTPATGVARTWDSKQEGPTYSGFVGQKVLISQENVPDGYGWQMFLWDPATGETQDPGPRGSQGADATTMGYPHMTISPGGSYLTGTTFPDGTPDPSIRCLHLESTPLDRAKVTWNTCDWRLNGIENSFSPDGTRLLVVPIETDGFGPRTFGVIDSSVGPSKVVAEVDLPEWTMFAEFADNDNLYVVRASDPDASDGYYVDRCDFEGNCTQVARSITQPAVGASR